LVLSIESRFGIQLSVMALSESATISKLADKLISQLKPTASSDEETTPSNSMAAQVQYVATQHATNIDSNTISLLVSKIEANSAAGSDQLQRIIQ